MWEAYNNIVETEHLKVKYEHFRKKFVENYNVGFRLPATDYRSKCLESKERELLKTEL